MVVVHRAHGFRFVIYTLDHEPAHVHITGAGQAKINLRGAGGVPEVVMPPYGHLVPPGRPLELADGICEMAADRNRLAGLGELGRKAMLESYTLDVFLDGYRWLYDEVRSRVAVR